MTARIPLFLLAVVLAGSSRSASGIELRTREVELAGKEVVHTVAVTGAPAISTSLVFPDTFLPQSASCGDCIHVQPGEMDSTAPSAGGRAGNWLVEKHPERRTIIVKPAVLPSARNPVSGFKTNLVVGLDNGHVVNVVLSLVQLRGEAGASMADAVVRMKLPEQATASGLLASQRRQLRATFDAEVEEAASRLLLQRLFGPVRCRSTSSKPYRSDRTVVRIRQLCSSAGEQRTFWCLFEVQNRSDAELFLERVELAPEAGVRGGSDPVRFVLAREALTYNQTSLGIAIYALDKDEPVPSFWRLQVTPGSPDRDPVQVSRLVF